MSSNTNLLSMTQSRFSPKVAEPKPQCTKTMQNIWKFLTGNSNIFYANSEIFEYLLKLNSIIFEEKLFNLYIIYKHLPFYSNNSKYNQDNKSHRSIRTCNNDRIYDLNKFRYTILINILWNYIREFIDVSPVKHDEAFNLLRNNIKSKSIKQIEHDVDSLCNNISWLKHKEIINNYGFNTPTDKVDILKSLSRFGYNRLYSKYIDENIFKRIFVNNRRHFNFVNAIINSINYNNNSNCENVILSQHHSVFCNLKSPHDFVLQVLTDYLIAKFKTISFKIDDWLSGSIKHIDQILLPNSKNSIEPVQLKSRYIQHKYVNWDEDCFRSSQYVDSSNIAQSISSLYNVKFIHIEECDKIEFISDDGKQHDLIETDKNWKPLKYPRYRKNASNNFNCIIQFRDKGVVYLRDNYYPNSIRIMINVTKCVSITKLFNKVITSSKLISLCPSQNHIFNPDFVHIFNKYLLAEAVLRRMTWKLLRIHSLPDHNILIRTLSFDQLKHIYKANTICDIISAECNNSAWDTLISNIGKIILSRALQSLLKCSNHQNIDIDKEALTRWYNIDNDYALVALCNILKPDGTVNICSLIGQIKARSTSGIRCDNYNQT